MGKKSSVAAGGGGADQTTSTPIPTPTSPENLKTLIHEHSLFFDQLVELIPARFFVPNYSDDKPWFPGLSKSEKNKFKAQTRENIIKSRRDRLDPSRPSSTLDLLKKSLAEEIESSGKEDDDDDNDDDDEEEEEENEVEEEAERAQNKATLTGDRPVTYEELRERLHRRIAELSAGRNTRPESRLKQERKEMKNKKKLKGETKKNQEKNKDKDKDAASGSNSGKRKREDGSDDLKNKKKNKVVEPTDITFGQVRIDGKENKKRKKRLSKEKELERAKRLEEVKKDPEKGQKISWKAAVSKAAGEKVHDDPKLLKQSIKREKKKQQKNAEKWKERERTVAKAKAEKQSKRSENIKERIHQKRMRKIEKREKKLMRPGFEGRKQGYIND
ncbi:Surfeit locus protein 6 [Rhynchospora pubera]|uniref:Surfeit locus protein 6 n=1 Tax=Rhynchospora pubera TaxID=906938 RepID=A0AAV8H7E1_9POAL|nr:Surfeit locus protein 6 [Rhynchospora pubera]